MKRIELFEFEDFDWLPNVIRNGVTNLIIVFHKLMGTAEVVSSLILSVKEKSDFDQIVDLGSGSGGAMLEIFKHINKQNKNFKLVFTDLHPNNNVVEEINGGENINIEYYPNPVNAANIGDTPIGLKTMIASFHHMKPEIAKKILVSAAEKKQPILIYEVAKNTIPIILWWLFLPVSLLILVLMSLVMTLFVRPLKFSQILFTYIIPIIPLVYAWDGQASLMRTYTLEDVRKLIINTNDKEYHWIIDDALKSDGKKLGYYIIGYPK